MHAGFGFREAATLAEYLSELGVTHLYCSPYLQAAPGSTHGYDVVNPQRLNDELGGAPGHAEMVKALRTCGLGQVLDIVPNHMAVDPTNPWWWDVLKNGPASRYSPVFDIDWVGPDPRFAFTVLVPVLGDHYGRVVDAGELTVARQGGDFVVRYFDSEWPVSPRSIDDLLATAARAAGSGELAGLAEGFGDLPSARLTDELARRERHEHEVALARALEELCREDPSVAAAVDAEVAAINHDPDRLDGLLRRQNYRLAYWRTASEDLDYRRFFNIESLIGVRVEDPEVFAETHRLILELVADATLDGLRVDHIDGLRDPTGYLASLEAASGGVYTVVEKILEPGESLPAGWPVAGTSGYDFLNRVNNLFVASANEAAMTACYHELTGETAPYEEIVHGSKHQVMREELAAEVERLTALTATLCENYRRHRDHTRRELRDAIRELVAHFPVYRTYVRPGTVPTDAERKYVNQAVKDAVECRPDLDDELIHLLGRLALGELAGDLEWEFAQRLAQLTSPVMAKGVEDTAFYRYHRLVSLNEVGGDPGVFGRSAAAFHADTQEMATWWPESMLTLSTHDTKRSADVRARLNVLSEIPGPWALAATRWMAMTDRHRRDGWPDRNTIYLLLQTAVGAWPIDAERLVAFMTKATREAKVHTSWVDPVAAYDDALEQFTRAVISDRDFVDDLEGFLLDHDLVARGRRNSLAQTALLLTCPGSPDLYQGDELWNLSLVDPDNRRPVDYDRRRHLLGALEPAPPGAPGDDGAAKLWLTHRLLAHRRARPGCYPSGEYTPLPLAGARADDAVAFTRGDLAVVVPRLGPGGWEGTTVELPGSNWTDVLTGSASPGGTVALAQLLAGFPVAVLARER
jgi:(1->4)-alpha-D-glucan 1-alpha-D-glucosylmutase